MNFVCHHKREAARLTRSDNTKPTFRHRRAAMANCLARHAARRVSDPGWAINYGPKPSLAREWSRTLREALVWLGEDDSTIEAIEDDDPELILLAAVMGELKKRLGNETMTAGDIKAAADERVEEPSSNDTGRYRRAPYRGPELRQVLIDAAGTRGEIDTRRLGGFLKRCKGRVVSGMKLVASPDRYREQQTWGVKQNECHGGASGDPDPSNEGGKGSALLGEGRRLADS